MTTSPHHARTHSPTQPRIFSSPRPAPCAGATRSRAAVAPYSSTAAAVALCSRTAATVAPVQPTPQLPRSRRRSSHVAGIAAPAPSAAAHALSLPRLRRAAVADPAVMRHRNSCAAAVRRLLRRRRGSSAPAARRPCPPLSRVPIGSRVPGGWRVWWRPGPDDGFGGGSQGRVRVWGRPNPAPNPVGAIRTSNLPYVFGLSGSSQTHHTYGLSTRTSGRVRPAHSGLFFVLLLHFSRSPSIIT